MCTGVGKGGHHAISRGGGRVSGMDQNIFFAMIEQIYIFSSCLVIKLFISLFHLFTTAVS